MEAENAPSRSQSQMSDNRSAGEPSGEGSRMSVIQQTNKKEDDETSEVTDGYTSGF